MLKRTALETPAPAVGGGSSPSTVRWFGDIVGAYLSGAATSLDGMDRSALLAPGMLRPACLKSKLNPPIFAKRRQRAAHYSGSVRLHGRDRSALRHKRPEVGCLEFEPAPCAARQRTHSRSPPRSRPFAQALAQRPAGEREQFVWNSETLAVLRLMTNSNLVDCATDSGFCALEVT